MGGRRSGVGSAGSGCFLLLRHARECSLQERPCAGVHSNNLVCYKHDYSIALSYIAFASESNGTNIERRLEALPEFNASIHPTRPLPSLATSRLISGKDRPTNPNSLHAAANLRKHNHHSNTRRRKHQQAIPNPLDPAPEFQRKEYPPGSTTPRLHRGELRVTCARWEMRRRKHRTTERCRAWGCAMKATETAKGSWTGMWNSGTC